MVVVAVAAAPSGRCCSPPATPSGSTAMAFIAPGAAARARSMPRARAARCFEEPLETYDGWAKWNRHYWLERLRGLPRVLLRRRSSPSRTPRSSVEDAVGWGLETDAGDPGRDRSSAPRFEDAEPRARADAPGSGARCSSSTATTTRSARTTSGAALAELTGGALVTLEGSGHCPQARDPVKVNLLLRDFVERASRRRRRVATGRRRAGRKRALYVSSPIGLGHARRDVAIAQGAAQARPGPRDRLARARTR